MRKEAIVPRAELETLVSGMAEVFIQRRDLYPRQLDDGRYICIRKPLTDGHLVTHLKGEMTLGAYVLGQESQTRFIVFDADDDEEMEGLISLRAQLAAERTPSYLESSRRGGHLWLFFARPVPGRDARRFGKALLETQGLTDIELFPKQDRLRSGPGSLIRLPFGIHRRTGQRYGFVTMDGRPLAPSLREQILILACPKTVPPAIFKAHQTQEEAARSSLACPKPESHAVTPSQRIKDNVSVLELVGQFVELSPNGRGLCPFHDDQRASFSVNSEENYWHCFAGCGGGSVIDFWMKWQDCDFTTAVRELAQMLL